LIVYFDTSAIVPVIIEEPASSAASRLWHEADRVVSSRLLYAEGRAALAMAHRMNRIDAQGLRAAVEELEALHEQLDLVEVTASLVREAGALAEKFALRGYDAVHVASAQLVNDPETVFAAGDRDLLAAARAAGISTADLTSHS
jgi:predicted nucleic acid-binding protein